MTVLIISSTTDPASINIKKELLTQDVWIKKNYFLDNRVYINQKMKNIVLITLNNQKIKNETIEEDVKKELGIKPKLAIFISRHKSKSGRPTLSTHPIGNYGNAEFGGKPKTLCPTAPRMMTQLLRNIKKNADDHKMPHQVCFEVTHHGPYMNIPSLFVEVGSDKEEWNKKKPAGIIAISLIQLLEKYNYEKDLPQDIPVILGIGGGHYAPRFTDVALNKKAAFGHMIPSYQIKAGNINPEMFKKALVATPNVSAVYFHKKALKKSQITEYSKWFENKGINVISSKQLDDL